MSSVSDSETAIAFEVGLEDSSDGTSKIPNLPPHLRIRMQTYVSSRPKKTIDVKLQEAENRRKRQIARRAENARRAEERCRRIAEAMAVVTDFNHHLKGNQITGTAPKSCEVRALYDHIKEDLNAVIGRVDREAMKMLDRKYVHNPVSYQPKRRNTHTAKCTCECCYLENKEKQALVQKDLMEVLTNTDLSCPSDENEGESLRVRPYRKVDKPYPTNVKFRRDPSSDASSTELGFSTHAILDIPIQSSGRHVSWFDMKPSTNSPDKKSKGNNVSLAVGPDCGLQTDDVRCQGCDTWQSLHNVTRGNQTKVTTADASCQTDPDLFMCHCCQKQL